MRIEKKKTPYVLIDRMPSGLDANFVGVKDEEKATYVAGQIVDKGLLPPFVYVLLPDDHTNGTDPGSLTPEAMISDNDYATGLLVDKISHSKWWSSTCKLQVVVVAAVASTTTWKLSPTGCGGDCVSRSRLAVGTVTPGWAYRHHRKWFRRLAEEGRGDRDPCCGGESPVA